MEASSRTLQRGPGQAGHVASASEGRTDTCMFPTPVADLAQGCQLPGGLSFWNLAATWPGGGQGQLLQVQGATGLGDRGTRDETRGLKSPGWPVCGLPVPMTAPPSGPPQAWSLWVPRFLWPPPGTTRASLGSQLALLPPPPQPGASSPRTHTLKFSRV